jgi:transposase
MDLSLYHAEIAALEGSAGRDHTSPRLLISLWLYAYSRGISSARELSRQCEFEPGSLWLCGCQAISYRTLSGFRSDHHLPENPFVSCQHSIPDTLIRNQQVIGSSPIVGSISK